jgi:hypothetical protein
MVQMFSWFMCLHGAKKMMPFLFYGNVGLEYARFIVFSLGLHEESSVLPPPPTLCPPKENFL